MSSHQSLKKMFEYVSKLISLLRIRFLVDNVLLQSFQKHKLYGTAKDLKRKELPQCPSTPKSMSSCVFEGWNVVELWLVFCWIIWVWLCSSCFRSVSVFPSLYIVVGDGPHWGFKKTEGKEQMCHTDCAQYLYINKCMTCVLEIASDYFHDGTNWPLVINFALQFNIL